MKNIIPLSQRDKRWGDTTLGYGTTKIKDYGCLITALTCLARGSDVRKVNDILKANNGYVGANGNLVVWAKVSVIPGLTFKYKYYYYDNQKVKQIIARDGGCVVEVDGAPIGGNRHWLLFIGDGKLIDPWDGQIKTTSSYQVISFVDIEYNEEESEEPMECCKELESVYKHFGVANFEEIKAWKEREEGFLASEREKNKQLQSELENEKNAKEKAQYDLALANNEKTKLEIKVKALEGETKSLRMALDEFPPVISELEKQIIAKNTEIAKLKEKLAQPTNLEEPILTKIADWIKKILGKLK